LWDSEKVRVEASKLPHKDELIDVHYLTSDGIEIAFNIAGSPNLMGVITFNNRRNRWDV
jgi:hypothetical protein